VCIWWYILQNYNYKLHFQNLFIYHIPHVFIETLADENLDVCTACDPWDSNMQLTMVTEWRWQNIKVLAVPLLGAGHAFPKQQHMCKGGGYLFLPRFFSLYDTIHGWMMGRMDGWMDESHEKTSQKTTTTSFTICNCGHLEILHVQFHSQIQHIIPLSN